MTPLFDLLGVGVGNVSADLSREARREAYEQSVTYASISELGFDTLRDRTALDRAELVSVHRDVAVIDEIDSVLLDEAVVPLVLAGGSGGTFDVTEAVDFVADLREGKHYVVEADRRNVSLTDQGIRSVEDHWSDRQMFGDDSSLLSAVNTAPHATVLLVTTAVAAGRRHGLSAYDATYLVLAERMAAPLATLDDSSPTPAAPPACH